MTSENKHVDLIFRCDISIQPTNAVVARLQWMHFTSNTITSSRLLDIKPFEMLFRCDVSFFAYVRYFNQGKATQKHTDTNQENDVNYESFQERNGDLFRPGFTITGDHSK